MIREFLNSLFNRLGCVARGHDWKYKERVEPGWHPTCIYKCERCGKKEKV